MIQPDRPAFVTVTSGPVNGPLVRGGQGSTDEQVSDLGGVMGAAFVGAAFAFMLLVGVVIGLSLAPVILPWVK